MKIITKTNASFFSAALAVFILAEILFYQFYYQVPITLNNKPMHAKKGEPLVNFLARKHQLPKYGRLLDVGGMAIPNKKGSPPRVMVNDKSQKLSYSIKADDEIKVLPGADKTEKAHENIEEVQSKLVYKGKGAFIYVIKKGRPGIRTVRRGLISKKISYSKWLITPQDYTIQRTNIRYKKVVALTFDDGPSKYTGLIMKILKQNKVKASFFVVGQMVKKRPAWLKEMAKRHYTIGNHTFGHLFLNKHSTKVIKQELAATDHEIYKAAKVRPNWVRPPGGALNSSAINLLLKQNYRISLWNVDTLDWQRRKSGVITEKILSNLKPGQVILMHDGGGNRMNTAKALPEIIKGIKAAGYRLVSLDDLYRLIQ